MLLNNRQWIFEDVHPQYTIGLVSIHKGRVDHAQVHLIGPFNSGEAYDEGARKPRVVFPVEEFRGWSSGVAFPLLPSPESGEVFLKLRRHPRFDASEGWRANPIQGDFNSTTGKAHMMFDPQDTRALWRVYKGASFDNWQPDTGEYYGWIEPSVAMRELEAKRVAGRGRRGSPFLGFANDWFADPRTLPCLHPRLAFRRITRATDSHTVRCALVPPEIVLTDVAPYLLWPAGDESDQAYLLGVLCSIPLDWYARRMVETHLDFHVLNPFPIPEPVRDAPLRRRVEQISGRLAAVDERYADWAAAVGVSVGSVAADEKDDLIAELDAAVSLLYGLDESDVRLIFETFHVGWDYAPRLEAVLGHYPAPEVAGMKPELLVNRPTENVADAINGHLEFLLSNLANPFDVAISTAYFNAEGFGLLAEALEKVGSVRLVLGAEPEGQERQLRHLDPVSGPEDMERARLRRALEGHIRSLETDRDLLGFSLETDDHGGAPYRLAEGTERRSASVRRRLSPWQGVSCDHSR